MSEGGEYQGGYEQPVGGEAYASAAPEERFDEASATRLSPYAVAAFVVGLFAVWKFPTALAAGAAFNGAVSRVIGRVLAGSAVPVVAGLLAMWLSNSAEDEIVRGRSRLGGIGLARAGRALGGLGILLVVLAVVVGVVFGPRGLKF